MIKVRQVIDILDDEDAQEGKASEPGIVTFQQHIALKNASRRSWTFSTTTIPSE